MICGFSIALVCGYDLQEYDKKDRKYKKFNSDFRATTPKSGFNTGIFCWSKPKISPKLLWGNSEPLIIEPNG